MNMAVSQSTFTSGAWWQSELIVLESMLNEHKTVSEIAEVLDCLSSRVRRKVDFIKENNPPPTKGGRPAHRRFTVGKWWDTEITVLKSMLEENYKVTFIAEVLDRDRHCVGTKIRILKAKGEIQ